MKAPINGILWSIVFFLTAAIYGAIPTYLIVRFWAWLNDFEIYTLSLLMLFLWIVSLIVVLIYIVAMIRAIVQRKNEDLGIPRGVKGFGLISTSIMVVFIIVWYLIFNKFAFFIMTPP
jgi:hypothetical protein